MTNRLTLLGGTCQVMDDLKSASSSGVLILSLMNGFVRSSKLIVCDCWFQAGGKSLQTSREQSGEVGNGKCVRGCERMLVETSPGGPKIECAGFPLWGESVSYVRGSCYILDRK